jgi:hypothetical protein
MIFQAAALAVLAALLLFAIGQRRRSGPLSYGIMLAAAVGAVLVIFPELSTTIANAVGIGRGADLIFYVFMLIVFAAIANLHLRLRAHAEVATVLARELALATARQPEASGGDKR